MKNRLPSPANLYFELAECIAGPSGQYFAAYSKSIPIVEDPVFHRHYISLARDSMRVWVEDASGVRFLKHRTGQASLTAVDHKEFMWIKLKCQPYASR